MRRRRVRAGANCPVPAGAEDGNCPAPPSWDPAPTILSVTPSIGSTGGGAHIKITGAGLLPGIRVAFGATNVAGWFDTYSGGVFVTTPSHAPGSVDVEVTNVDGQNAVAMGAYTFAAPESFDVNGNWRGVSFAGDYDEPFTFTVVNGAVVSITCSTSGLVRLSPPAPIIHGEFCSEERMVSPSPAGSWHRTKRWVSSTSAQPATSAHASERNGTPPRNSRDGRRFNC